MRHDYAHCFSPAREVGIRKLDRNELNELDRRAHGLTPTEPGGVNPGLPAGYTYLMQLATHDLSQMVVQEANGNRWLRNLRTPRLDLDSMYGRGPDADPLFYGAGKDRVKFAIGRSAASPRELDLPRREAWKRDPESGDMRHDAGSVAVIADARNDENVIISQFLLAMMRLHNRFVDERLDLSIAERFAEAQKMTRWHFQFVIMEDLLPKLCPGDLRLERWKQRGGGPLEHAASDVVMPLEFSVAALRVGHSMIRSKYTLNEGGFIPDVPAARDLKIVSSSMSRGLQGGRALREGWTIQWDQFVAHEDPDTGTISSPQPSMAFDTKLARPLRTLPVPPPVPETHRILAFLDLMRGEELSLATGYEVADFLQLGQKLPQDAPLWEYLLREAEQETNDGGRRFGPVCAEIVGRTLYDLMWADPDSYLHDTSGFARGLRDADFDLAALLAMSGAPMTNADLRS